LKKPKLTESSKPCGPCRHRNDYRQSLYEQGRFVDVVSSVSCVKGHSIRFAQEEYQEGIACVDFKHNVLDTVLISKT
jgi:hypothetical protein